MGKRKRVVAIDDARGREEESCSIWHALVDVAVDNHAIYEEEKEKERALREREREREKERERERTTEREKDRERLMMREKTQKKAEAAAALGIFKGESSSMMQQKFKQERLLREKALKRPVEAVTTPQNESPLMMKQQFYEGETSGTKTEDGLHESAWMMKKRLYEGEKSGTKIEEGLHLQAEKKQKISSNSAPTHNDPPEHLKNYIMNIGGSTMKLLIQKHLTATDVSYHHDRLSMPLSQICRQEFLTSEEKKVLDSRTGKKLNCVRVTLIQRSLERHEISLRKWDMKKGSGNSSSSYVLNTTWNQVVEQNELREGDLVQLWSFRVQSKLHFALVKIN